MERFCFFHRKTCHLVQDIVRKYLPGAKKHQQPVRYFSWLPHQEGIMAVVALAGKLGNGKCTIMKAELWAIFLRFQLALSRGFSNLFAEGDSLIAVKMVNQGVHVRT